MIEHTHLLFTNTYCNTCTRVVTSGSIYWANAGEAVMITNEDKYAAFAGAERMLNIAVAQRLPGDEQAFRIQLRGVSLSSSVRIGWRQLESANAPTSGIHLPNALLCPVARENFTNAFHIFRNMIIQVKLVSAERKVTYCWEKFDRRLNDTTLPDMPLAADVDVSKLHLAAILDEPGDAALLLPPEAGLSWAPQIIPQTR